MSNEADDCKQQGHNNNNNVRSFSRKDLFVWFRISCSNITGSIGRLDCFFFLQRFYAN